MSRLDARRYAPVALILLLVAVPLAVWAATSGGSGDDEKGLIVERGTSLSGDPELVISIAGEVQVRPGASFVRVQCTDARGDVIISGTQPWPFLDEPGYEYPHVHQVDAAEKIQGARRCRVLGTDTRLSAAVQ